jgi:hypothetical protein
MRPGGDFYRRRGGRVLAKGDGARYQRSRASGCGPGRKHGMYEG